MGYRSSKTLQKVFLEEFILSKRILIEPNFFDESFLQRFVLETLMKLS